ncbi:hypothetical protein QMK19_38645 [Streptomyces sp. H10-C2]|uniref:hypothetical protein n=1 Tax=unclassified Streptomyces TaxID=2593676 RepID=UPI0024BA5221|nr:MULTISPECIES: hypothetical protein [unclassified Streptomyces]MDJ0346816.1 hypothetical protein [Streptomyces sp. PH10-H1]MDJ0375359.1 hypothetical protein [Streptomyces sp. H10-C2]
MDTETRFRHTMDSITRSSNASGLADLVRHAAVLIAHLDGHPSMADAPEAFRATLYAAEGTTHLHTLAGLAWRAGLLWDRPDDTTADHPRAAFAGCLPETSAHPAVSAASAAARAAAIPLAVFGHDYRADLAPQGLSLAPDGAESVECSWFIDGRATEPVSGRAGVTRAREARNAALIGVRDVLAARGWSVHLLASRRTATVRVLNLLATPPR